MTEEIKDDTNRWREMLHSWLGRINVVKKTIQTNLYCDNDHTTHSNLPIQCNPYQITNGIFHGTRTKNLTICLEIQKTLCNKSNLEKEKWSWSNQAP